MNRQQTGNDSRRSFFTKSAALFGATALANKILHAQTTTPGPGTSSDIDILNYALALEHLESAFYVQGVARYTAADYNNSIYAPVFGSKITSNFVPYITAIRDHEVAHVSTLQQVIQGLGGTPVQACTYNFGVNSASDFLSTAMMLENVGVQAYDGAISMISNADIKKAAATIATVEARHASYLNFVNGQLPAPAAFDTTRSRADVLAMASAFITLCPAGGGPTTNPAGPTISGLSATVNTRDREVQFNFAGSAAPDGSAVSFMFQQVSGPTSSLIGERTSTPRVILTGGRGTYVYELVVTDGRGNRQTGRTTIVYS